MRQIFDGFDPADHEQETERRWGGTEACREASRRTRSCSRDDWTAIKRDGDHIVEEMARPFAAGAFGLHLPITAPEPADLILLTMIVVAGFLVGSVPAFRAYRLSLADGLSMRI